MSTSLVHGRPWSAGARRPRRLLALLLTVLLAAAILPVLAAAGPVDAAEDAGDVVPGQLLVKFRSDAPGQARAQARAAARAEEVSTIEQLGVHVWRVPEHAAPRALHGLQQNPHIEFAEFDAVIELDGEVHPNDPQWSRQWGPVQVGTPSAWATSMGTGSTIAVLDTGVAPVDDLKAKLLPGYNAMTRATGNTNDDHGHGTAVAGIAAADTDNGLGVAGYCWDCSILPVKVMESSGSTSDLAAGITWAADNGADVISMSLSGASGTTTLLNAVRYAVGRDVNLVAAAGNQGGTTKRYPAAYAEVIAVAGTDANDALYSWSNYGSWVDVAAPGSNRTTTRSGIFGNFAGTSSATPAVAGVLGLARSQGASATEARAALEETSVPLGAIGQGRVDARMTVEVLDAGSGSDPEPEPEPEPDPEPVAPTAAFSAACEDLTCTFVDESSAGDASLDSRAWDLGDGTAAHGPEVVHTYGADGTYTVTLTVTDADGLADTSSQTIDVAAPAPEPEPEPDPTPEPLIDLTVDTTKTRGLNLATLRWSGADGSRVDVIIDDAATSVSNTGSYTHDTGTRGNPTIIYQVCDGTACSDPVEVSSW
jgi:PKD repeat protein